LDSANGSVPRGTFYFGLQGAVQYILYFLGYVALTRILNPSEIGEVPLLIIEGKVSNHSGVTRRHVKIRVVVFDQEKVKVAEKETVCGRILSRGELKNLQASFFKGEMVNEPKEEEMITPPGKAIPFMVIFKDLSNQAKEFKVEIVEAPSL
jgi:hypothetical protein